MIKKIIGFIHSLRIVFLVFIICGFFGVVGINPVNLSEFLGAKFGQAIGMSVSVPENPFNKIALQLQEKENSLNQREIELNKRADELSAGKSDSQNPLITYLMLGIFVLFILVLANYYLDFKRRKTEKNYSSVKQ
jgi:hypothetical protein